MKAKPPRRFSGAQPTRVQMPASNQSHARYDPKAEQRYHHIFIDQRALRRRRFGCCFVALLPFVFLAALLAFLLAPGPFNILLLGLDSRPGEGDLSRSDSMILARIDPPTARVSALSIPRDLWVQIPGVGENRINAAHFFAETLEEGAGPQGALETVRINFGVPVDYYVRLRFDGFTSVIDAMGGVDVELPTAMSGYPAGTHHLSGEQALALVRDRQDSDDFYRMERGQLFIKSLVKALAIPTNWVRLPQALTAAAQATDSNVPLWLWPRLGLALLRAGPDGMQTRTINRDMVTPFTTSEGAAVLQPNWDAIRPVVNELFFPK